MITTLKYLKIETVCKTYHCYKIEMNAGKNLEIAWKLSWFDKNTWNHMIVFKQSIFS